MKLSIIGTGYVGLVQGACFADSGNDVICMDIDEAKITGLQQGTIPIYEPGLQELVTHNVREGRLRFSTSIKDAVQESDVIFLCLPTPQGNDGSADVQNLLGTVEQIARHVDAPKILVSKSTVPVGTTDRIIEVVKRHANHPVEVAMNPEFLKEGSAVEDSLKPDRVIIGSRSERAVAVLRELYAPFVRTGAPIMVMDERSAEMTKYAANAFLATKVTFMNEIALLCERVGADVELVRQGIAADPRIGKLFLFAGVGFGGSCFPKDLRALLKTSEEKGFDFKIARAVHEANERQKRVLVEKIKRHFGNTLDGVTIAVWGLSFKPRTDDIREAPSLVILEELLNAGASLKVHDPAAIAGVRKRFAERLSYFDSAYDALTDVDALVVVTEWNEFRRPDFERMKKLMKQAVIFDGRNIYEPAAMRQRGFVYYGIGR